MNYFNHYHHRVYYKTLIGSRAYGLAHEASDYDIRGIYIAPINDLLGLTQPPEQLEQQDNKTDICYWEVGKFCKLALANNPAILEIMDSPVSITAFAELDSSLQELLNSKLYLSKRIYQTYGGYAKAQLEKFEKTKNYKNAMHMLRLLISGTYILQAGVLKIDVSEQRDFLLKVRLGDVKSEKIMQRAEEWQKALAEALAQTSLPDVPQIDRVNELLIQVRHAHR